MFIWKTCFLMWNKVYVSSVYVSFKKISWMLPVQNSVHQSVYRNINDPKKCSKKKCEQKNNLLENSSDILAWNQSGKEWQFWVNCIPPPIIFAKTQIMFWEFVKSGSNLSSSPSLLWKNSVPWPVLASMLIRIYHLLLYFIIYHHNSSFYHHL